MKKQEEIGLDFEIDKLTNSIQNVITGDSFATEVIMMNSISEFKNVLKKNKWQFNGQWRGNTNSNRSIVGNRKYFFVRWWNN